MKTPRVLLFLLLLLLASLTMAKAERPDNSAPYSDVFNPSTLTSNMPSSLPSFVPTESCDVSNGGECEFVTEFEIDLGEDSDLLLDAGARADFSSVATDWANRNNACAGVTNVTYYSFYVDPPADVAAQRRSLYTTWGYTSGKCSGDDCPSEIEVSFPDRRRRRRRLRGRLRRRLDESEDDDCEVDEATGEVVVRSLLDELREQTESFRNIERVRMNQPKGRARYAKEQRPDHGLTENECAANPAACSTEQKNATRTMMVTLGTAGHSRREEDHECQWKGVRCRGSEVAAIKYVGKNLEGSLTDEKRVYEALNDLEDILLGENLLTGTIPNHIGTLLRLRDLKLETNQLTGTVPTELGRLESLRHINLANNGLTGTFPTEIALLPKLKSLFLNGNDLTIEKSLFCSSASLKDTDLQCDEGVDLDENVDVNVNADDAPSETPTIAPSGPFSSGPATPWCWWMVVFRKFHGAEI